MEKIYFISHLASSIFTGFFTLFLTWFPYLVFRMKIHRKNQKNRRKEKQARN